MSHDPHGNPDLQHHFDTMDQQFSASKLGMWLFLAQEVLFFGGLFCAYVIFRVNYPELYSYAAHTYLDKFWGAFNTVILLISSFTMALGVRNAQLGQRKALLVNLTLTFLCAGGFMAVKFVEYRAKFEHGTLWAGSFDYPKVLEHEAHAGHGTHEVAIAHAAAVDPAASSAADQPLHDGSERSQIAPAATGPAGLKPAAALDPAVADDPHQVEGPRPPNLHLFFSIYFCLTGLHGLHVLGGMVMLAWLFVGAWKGRYHGGYFTPVDLGGLYWHLVDLVWIFLFPLLYLI